MGLQFAEGAVTLRPRREIKLVLEATPARGLLERLRAELGLAPLSTLVTSVYFDGPELPLTRRALSRPEDSLKVRTKEYFPDLDEPARPRVVLEVKRERNGVTHKKREWVPRAALSGPGERGAGVLPFIASRRLEPVLGVTYIREVYQRTESWRVTVDRDVTYYRVTREVALSGERLGPERLAPAVHRDSRVVFEVKHVGAELPGWLARMGESAERPYSKFTEGMSRLMARRADGAMGG